MLAMCTNGAREINIQRYRANIWTDDVWATAFLTNGVGQKVAHNGGTLWLYLVVGAASVVLCCCCYMCCISWYRSQESKKQKIVQLDMWWEDEDTSVVDDKDLVQDRVWRLAPEVRVLKPCVKSP